MMVLNKFLFIKWLSVKTFWFLQSDLKTPFKIDFNALYGQVDIYVDVEEIKKKQLKKIKQMIFTMKNIKKKIIRKVLKT